LPQSGSRDPARRQYDDIRGAAKHLSSIARAWNSSDDITVVGTWVWAKTESFLLKRLLGFRRVGHASDLGRRISIVVFYLKPSLLRDGPRSSFCRQRSALDVKAAMPIRIRATVTFWLAAPSTYPIPST